MPSVSSKSTGSPPSSSTFSFVHGIMPLPSSTPQVWAPKPTGETPSASAVSWLAQPTAATLVGFASIVVVPSACSIVMG
jgi:hypothetical protein